MILGVDLSSNNPVFNFTLARSQGVRLVYVKLGGDNIPEYVSGSYQARIRAAYAAGMVSGSYWITGGHNPDGAAAFFGVHLEHLGADDFWVLDNEKLDNGNPYNDAEAAEWVRYLHGQVGGSAARILHYGSKSLMESRQWPQLLATGCSFLIADYNGTPLVNHVPSTIPASRVVGHQYADNGNFGGASVDANAFVDSFLTTVTSTAASLPLPTEILNALENDDMLLIQANDRLPLLIGPLGAVQLPLPNSGNKDTDALNQERIDTAAGVYGTKTVNTRQYDVLRSINNDYYAANAKLFLETK